MLGAQWSPLERSSRPPVHNRFLPAQEAIARVAVGKVAPSPKPSMKRIMKSEASPPAKPVRIVAAAQITLHKPTAEYLEQRIRIGECGEDQPELGIAEARIHS